MANRHRSWPNWHVSHYWTMGFASDNASNNAADEIINGQADKHLLTQADLFEAQGGWGMIGCSMAATAMFTAAVVMGSPATAAHIKTGSCSFMQWACLLSAGSVGYCAGRNVGKYGLGDAQKAQNHWMAYTWVKNQNRFEGRTILIKPYTY